MFKNKIAAFTLGTAFLLTPSFANNARKECIKQAKSARESSLATCKSMKGSEKKECKKQAKVEFSKAKDACKQEK